MDLDGDYDRHLLVRVDATGYGASNDIRQAEIQATLGDVLDEAALAAGLDRALWHTQPAGDGELAVLPGSVRERSVVDGYTQAIASVLSRGNGRVAPGDRLRVRLAVHFGVVSIGRLGFPGQGAVEVSRMVDGAPVRLALRRTGAQLAVVLSETIYRDSVAQGHTELRPEQLREVEIVNKEFHRRAWLHLPGHDVHEVDLRPEPGVSTQPAPEPGKAARAGTATPPGPGPQFTQTFEGPVRAERINFGISYGSDA
ncbi:hypothetical protein [Actinoplanes sp. RD1]|uniref:hypothetical protein n=1 Tax=Actinoplanes sp. RD1 TaxID=3064538 RepID=UPI0027424C1A|nr:hypothetical protein [Actinoplanes sp. RD1]